MYTFDGETHEGWNVIATPEDSPYTYHTFRFYGSQSGSCRVSEVELYGVEVIDSTATSYDCTPELTVAGVSTTLSDVTFD